MMKFKTFNSPKAFFIGLMVFFIVKTTAQTNTFPSTGNVGIGTLNPNARLQIKSINGFDATANLWITNNASVYGSTHLILTGRIDAGNDDWQFGTGARNAIVFSQNEGGTSGSYGDEKFSLQLEGNSNNLGILSKANGNTPLMLFAQNGYIGIGTQNPLAKLDIRDGNILVKNLANTTGESVPMISQSLRFGSYTKFGTSINTFTENDGYNSYALQFFTQDTYVTGPLEKLRIAANGNVGIGTTTPAEKLAVNGKIRAKEIKVEVANWPDYVFEDNYRPKTLAEIESFVRENKRLPEVPSTKEVEANGIELGEMNKILLKKIEELTLHLIQKDKEIKELTEAVRQLKKNVKYQKINN